MVIGAWQIARLWDGDLYILKPRDDLNRPVRTDDFDEEKPIVYGPPVVVSLDDTDVTRFDNQEHLEQIYRKARMEVHRRNKARLDPIAREISEL